MRNQRIISQTIINAETNPVLDTWHTKSIGNSRGSTLIYNMEDKESNNRQDGSMPSIDIKSPIPHVTKSQLSNNRNRNMNDSKTMNINNIIGRERKNSRMERSCIRDEDVHLRLPQMIIT